MCVEVCGCGRTICPHRSQCIGVLANVREAVGAGGFTVWPECHSAMEYPPTKARELGSQVQAPLSDEEEAEIAVRRRDAGTSRAT